MTQMTKFPSWAPKILCEDLQEGEYDDYPDIVELATRLITYPEMETVWQRYRGWMKFDIDYEKTKNKEAVQYIEAFRYVEEQICYEGLFDIAVNALSEKNKHAAISQTKRTKSLLRVAKHAKQLSQSLDSIGMPDDILWYFPWCSVLDVFRTSAIEIYQDATGEESFAEPEVLESTLDKLMLYQKGFSIRELLKILADDEKMNRLLPDTIVQRAKAGNKRRLFLIRSCAEHLKYTAKQSPMKERGFISSFARTVLDDPEINEDVVKDALRGFDLPDRERFGITKKNSPAIP